ncbi:MAG: hypothetical protein M1815_003038 [Lichina confinis]|nr:MAG: hypothetical protein M1815_003038 [Lichina confinis]
MLSAPWLAGLGALLGPTAWALPQASASASSLPEQLDDVLPTCARACLAGFVGRGWPSSVCGSKDELGCLCRTRSTSGFTLGEVGVQCVASSCSFSQTLQDEGRMREVCFGQDGALPNTHSLLTATTPPSRPTEPRTSIKASIPVVTDTAETSSPSSTRSATSRSASITSTSESSSVATSSTAAAAAPSTVTTVSTSDVPQASTSATAATKESSRPLTREQIAGVCVGVAAAAAVIAVSIAAACLYFGWCVCRRKRRRDTAGFKTLPSPRPGDDGERGWYGRLSDQAGVNEGRRSVQEKPRAPSRLTTQWPAVHPAAIGVALSPESKQSQFTPKPTPTVRSRSDSTLLPDKPVYRPVFPAPPRTRPFSETTVIEEEDDDAATPPAAAATAAAAAVAAAAVAAAVARVDDGYEGSTSSCHTSLGWPSGYYSPDFESDNPHLRGYQYARHLSNPPIVPPMPSAAESVMAEIKQGKLGAVVAVSHTRSPSSLGQRDHRKSGGGGGGGQVQSNRWSCGSRLRHSTTSATSFETQDDLELGTDRGLTPVRELYEADEDKDHAVSPISPERLKYPVVPRSLSGAGPRGPPFSGSPAQRRSHLSPLHALSLSPSPSPARPRPQLPQPPQPPQPLRVAAAPGAAGPSRASLQPPPLLRNDTYGRSEDLVIATSQALTQATGSRQFTEQHLLADAATREEDLRRLHLADEVERARQGLDLMRERAAAAAANIRGTAANAPDNPAVEVRAEDPSPSYPKHDHQHHHHPQQRSPSYHVFPVPPHQRHETAVAGGAGGASGAGAATAASIPKYSTPSPSPAETNKHDAAHSQPDSSSSDQPRNLRNVPARLPRLTPTKKDGDLCLVLDPSSSSSSPPRSWSSATLSSATLPSTALSTALSSTALSSTPASSTALPPSHSHTHQHQHPHSQSHPRPYSLQEEPQQERDPPQPQEPQEPQQPQDPLQRQEPQEPRDLQEPQEHQARQQHAHELHAHKSQEHELHVHEQQE